MTQPTGVFVRLPLSDGQRMTANEAPYKKDRKGSALEASILSIGTPVTGGSLIPIGEVAGHFSDGQPMVRILKHPNLPYKTEIALYSDAQAAIAALEAEVGWLRAENEKLHRIAYSGRGTLTHTIHSPARFADEARKGPEA